MTFVIVVIILFTVLFIGALYTIAALKKAKLTLSLKKTIRAGSKEKTLNTLLKIIEKEPFNIDRRIQAVQLLMELGNYSEALVQLKSILAEGKDRPELNEKEIHKTIASCHIELGNLDDAFETLTHLKEMGLADVSTYIELGRIEVQRGRKNSAVEYFKKASGLEPDNPHLLTEYGKLLYNVKKYREALVVFNRALSKNQNEPEINYYLGDLNYRNQHPEEALHYYLKARYDPRFTVKSGFNAGQILRKLNRLDEARKLLSSILPVKGLKRDDMLNIRYTIGEICLAQNDFQSAIQQWESIMSHVSNFKDVREKLDKYEQTKSNRALRAYMMSSQNEFMQICKKIASLSADNVVILRAIQKKDASVEIFTQSIHRATETTILFKFFRGTSNIGQLTIREFYESLKERNARLGVCFTSSDFTVDALSFSRGRMLELRSRKEFLKILTKAVT